MKRERYLLRMAALFLSALLLLLGGCTQHGGEPEGGLISTYQYANEPLGFTMDFPLDWKERIEIEEGSGLVDGSYCITVYHKETLAQEGHGVLFFIDCYPGEWSAENPPVQAGYSEVVLQTEEYTYLFRTPSGVEYSETDERLAEDYQQMTEQFALIMENVNELIPASSAEGNGGQETAQQPGDQNKIAANEGLGWTMDSLSEIGKTLSELKNEYPEGGFIVSLDGLPDAAAICFGEPGAEYVYYFFGTQDGDAEKAMNECEDQLKCAGFITTANVLFPDMADDMSFEDFFSLIGVDDYEYLGEDTAGAGWLRFTYNGMEVMVNTNEAAAGGGWDFTGAERVKSNAPVSIVDPEISNTNYDLAKAVMFD